MMTNEGEAWVERHQRAWIASAASRYDVQTALIAELEACSFDDEEGDNRDDLLRYEGAATERAKIVVWLIATGYPGQAGAIAEGSHHQ